MQKPPAADPQGKLPEITAAAVAEPKRAAEAATGLRAVIARTSSVLPEVSG